MTHKIEPIQHVPTATSLVIDAHGRNSEPVDIRFFPEGLGEGYTSSAGDEAWITVNVGVTGSRFAVIAGNDLWALREQLNMMPESAFTPPAPPAPRWTDGDVVRTYGGPLRPRILVRAGLWSEVGNSSGFGDQDISEIVDQDQNVWYIREGRQAEILRQQSGVDL